MDVAKAIKSIPKAAQPVEKVYKVFYDDNGKLYKAEKAKAISHAEMTFPTKDILKALTETPCSREEMIARINHADFNREEAVLASDEKTELTQGGQ